ncbi:MAG: hypothetical protein ACOYD0_10220 [Candidatus Nanopelagicales bacterium]
MSTPSEGTAAAAPPQPDLLSLAGSVHTFESFGRAVVQTILQASAKQTTEGAGFQATASVTPLAAPTAATFTAGEKAAGSGAASSHCYQVALDFGGDYPVTVKVCV